MSKHVPLPPDPIFESTDAKIAYIAAGTAEAISIANAAAKAAGKKAKEKLDEAKQSKAEKRRIKDDVKLLDSMRNGTIKPGDSLKGMGRGKNK